MVINIRQVKAYIKANHPTNDNVRVSREFLLALEGEVRRKLDSAMGLPSNRRTMVDILRADSVPRRN